MSDVNQNPFQDGSIPADADLAPDIADDDEVAGLLPGGSAPSGDSSEEAREDVAPEGQAPLP